MKILLTLALAIALFSQSLYSQKKLPKFGEISKDDLLMKNCSFDKTAPAMILFDEAEAFFDVNLNMTVNPITEQTTRRTRIKIFDKKGFDRANIKIAYSASSEVSIKKFYAQTYNLDANNNVVVTKVDKASIYDKELNKRARQKIFTFPEVKEGSILEFEYVLDGQIQSEWYFQRSIPTLISQFIINFPKTFDIATVTNMSLPYDFGKNPKISDNYSFYTMQNVPAFEDEPYISTENDYLQRLEIRPAGINLPGIPYRSLLRTWPGIIKALIDDEDFGRQLKKDIPRTADLDKLLEGVSDTLMKMKIIHKYVRENMKWNEKDNIWALEGVKKAWKDKEGTSGEINLILVNLLKDAHVNVKPILVSTRDNGIINTSYAGYDQFNKVMAYVELGNKQYVLDATETITPTDVIPLSVMASEGLVIGKIDKYEWGWKTIWDVKNKFKRGVYINALINTNNFEGVANIISSGYDRIERLVLLKKGMGKLTDDYKTEGIATIDSFNITNENDDTKALIQNFNFKAPIKSTGGYNYFSINHFCGFNKNPFLSEERKSDIFYGAQQEYTISANIELPKGALIDELPKNIKMVTPDKFISFQRISQFNDGVLDVQVIIKFDNPFYTADLYPDLKEFYKQMYDLLNEKYVYKL
ncbi:MAG: DUF3857 domain-containing protein [Ferruginibacter sp.]|nr:DUF3857 domain-containing protein [Ferruginibacter sp.]